METTGSAAEANPLKRGEDGGEAETAPSATELKEKKSCKEVLGFAKLTHWRTAAFFLSLFVCLTIVFAFSFIIPCPVRPQYLLSWNRTFSEAGAYNCVLHIAQLCLNAGLTAILSFSSTATYDFLAIEDTSRDKVMDVLFVLRNTEGSENNTCAGAGMNCSSILIIASEKTRVGLLYIICLFCVIFFQVCHRHVCTCQQWMGQMERACGSVSWILSSTGPSVVWTKTQAEPGTV